MRGGWQHRLWVPFLASLCAERTARGGSVEMARRCREACEKVKIPR